MSDHGTHSTAPAPEHVSVPTTVPAASAVDVDPLASTARQRVRDVMTRAVVTAGPDAAFKEIVLSLARDRISTIPVVDAAGHVLGVVTASDLLARVSGEHGRAPRGHRLTEGHETARKTVGLTAAQLMTAPALTVGPDDTIADAAAAAARSRVRALPVVDADRSLVGIVTKSDLVKIFLRSDAEILSDVRDAIERTMLLESQSVEAHVAEGVVTLHGELPRRLLQLQLHELLRAVPGVVALDDHTTFRIDDAIKPFVWP